MITIYNLKIIPGYQSLLSLRETECAIKVCKDIFERELSAALNLQRVSAPIIVKQGSGINDDLNGVERKVQFDIKEIGVMAEVVQSLAKWKREALYRYGFGIGEGLYTDMNALRRDDDVDNLHSIFVDQWDWERVIVRENRNQEFLHEIVLKVVKAVAQTKRILMQKFPQLKQEISENVYFITSQELEDKYPDLTPEEREIEITREHQTVFIGQIGNFLKSGKKHGGRAPDYDDWQINGDIFVWSDALDTAIEISSMGVRVDKESLLRQLALSDANERLEFAYHQGIVNEKLPLTIGGGIGQSRICMVLLEKVHIGEVQASVWPEKMLEECKKNGIEIL